MTDGRTLYRWTELDRTRLPEFLDRVERFGGDVTTPRSYPGFPRRPLPRVGARRLTSLDRTLATRRCVRRLGTSIAPPATLARLHRFAHGDFDDHHRGPTPSAGGLQAIELYEVHVDAGGWLAPGVYHYDRAGHHLSQLVEGAARAEWEKRVPSWRPIEGGAWLWIVVGDAARVEAKYGERAYRFLLLEAGHLMQNLCLLSASVGLCTVPLGGFFEREIARALGLPGEDVVLYAGVCG